MLKESDENKIKEAQKEWEDGPLHKSLKEHGEREKEFKTYECPEFVVKRLYTPLDAKGDYVERIGFPGVYPFTRGIDPTMYRSDLWKITKYSGFGGGEDVNERYKKVVAAVERPNLYLALDLPTQLGYDSDDPHARGEVGRAGLAIDSLKDVEDALKGIPFDKLSKISATAMCIGPIFMAMFIALAEKQGLTPEQYTPNVQNGSLKEYSTRGTYIFPPRAGLRVSNDVVEYCIKHMPNAEPLTVTGAHFRESGANAVQELAFAMADVIGYAEEILSRGVSVDDFGRLVWCYFSIHHDVLEEVAKLRAARRMWAKIMKERFGAKDPEACKMKMMASNGGSTLTAQQPLNNIARITLQVLSAALGGAQDFMSLSYDEGQAIPTEQAMMVDIRVQQIVQHESGVANTVDPLGGSYYIETLTDQIEEGAWEYIKRIDALGGAVAAIEKGFFQREIARSAYEQFQRIRNRTRIHVGVNKFNVEEEVPIETFRVNPEWELKQVGKLAKLRKERDNGKVEKALLRLKEAAKSNENLMPATLEAVKAYATIGEMCGILREVFGEYKAPVIV